MLDYDRLTCCEIHCYRRISNAVNTEYGVLFYNEENPQSHDSNHAVILRENRPLEWIIDQIERFYRQRKLTPRLYSLFRSAERERLTPALRARGWQFLDESYCLYVWQRPSHIAAKAPLEIRRARTLEPGIIEVFNSEGGEPWTIGVLQRHLPQESFHLLVGCVDGQPVTTASLAVMDGLTAVGDVMTHRQHRGRGYARALLHYLVQYHAALGRPNALYLFASNPVAIRIYEEAGFVPQEPGVDAWSAYLPDEVS
jgi:GNAT superfamily N-acetyltransferase